MQLFIYSVYRSIRMIGKPFFLACGLSFPFLDGIICSPKVFNVDVVPFIFFLLSVMLLVSYLGNHYLVLNGTFWIGSVLMVKKIPHLIIWFIFWFVYFVSCMRRFCLYQVCIFFSSRSFIVLAFTFGSISTSSLN